MKIFYTRSTQHIIEKIQLPLGQFTIKQFSDGELYVKIEQNILGEEIWVIASTVPPAENLLELFLLLDALVNTGAQKINLLFLYFGYARQAFAQPGEAASPQLICDILKIFPINRTYIIHAHAAQELSTFFRFENSINFDFFCAIAPLYDVIAAPDKGAAEFATSVANMCKKEMVYLHKTRPKHEEVKIEAIDGAVMGKKILLVDDIISTGRTLIEACQALKNLGATEISAAATHAIFSNGARERLESSPLQKIYITNTIDAQSQGKIEVVDMSSFIKKIIA